MNQNITHGPTWHQLDPDVGGYMCAHIGQGNTLVVFTTPISTASQEEHRDQIFRKIEKYREDDAKKHQSTE